MNAQRERTLVEYRAAMAADPSASFYEAPKVRTITLYGTLTGTIWQGCEAQLPVTVDLRREASRFVNANGSGLVDAIRAAVDDAGDFISAKLTADSFVMVEHRRLGAPDGTIRSWARRVDVCDLPSLADYVDGDAFSYGPED